MKEKTLQTTNLIQKIHFIMIGLSAVGIVFVSVGLYLDDTFFWSIADSYFYVIFVSIIVTSLHHDTLSEF